jgi:inner membrane protein
MHVQTHIMSGWCVGNLFPLNPRQRLMCMIAASIADLDGLGILAGQEAYWNYHHKLGHNLAFGVAACIVLALLSRARLMVFALYLALFHLHLVMDFFGSGPGWPIYYLWPFSHGSLDNQHWSWDFYSWQNITTALVLIAWTVAIAVCAGRTPLEVPMPRLDRQLVEWLRARFKRPVDHKQV